MKVAWKGYTMYNYYIHSRKDKTMGKVEKQCLPMLGVRETNWGAQRIFRVWNFYDTICWIHVIICLFKLIQSTTPRVNSNINYELWVLMCQYRFISCNRCNTLGGMLIMREAIHTRGQKLHGKFLYLLLNFAINLKLLFKKKMSI